MPIYLERGFKNNRIEVLQNTTNTFEWLASYEPKRITRKKDETDDSYIKRIAELKPKQQYFISGYIEPNERGTVKRNNESLIRRDLIILDYDEIETTSDTFKKRIIERLPNTNIIIYPTIRHTDTAPRFRVVVEPSRPLLKYEYLAMLKEVAERIGLKCDKSSETWSQCQGLPVLTEFNEKEGMTVFRGDKYTIPRNIEPPIERKKNDIQPHTDIVGEIDHDDAIAIFKAYIKRDEANLYEYNNAIHAILVLAKAVQSGEIDYNTALECSELLALGNIEWIEGNRQHLNTAVQKTEIRTPYTFKRKFYDLFQPKEIRTMKDVYRELEEQGEAWRIENAEENEKTGQVKYPLVPPLKIAEIITRTIPVILLGDMTAKDRSLIYYYNHDTGLYTVSEIELNKMILKVEYRSQIGIFKNVIEILKTLIPLEEHLQDRYLIPVQNGVYNLKTKTLEPFNPSYIITSKIATAYNPNAKKPPFFDVDAWFNSLACSDDEIVTLLWQMINEAINPNYTRKKIGFLVGASGNNGKGTYQMLLVNLVGKKNVSTLKPNEFAEKFKTAQLIGKVCNIGDDIGDAYLDDISNLMSIATGDGITVEEKGQKAFSIYTKAFCLFSGNSLPRARNKTGWIRRMLIIPFNADFSGMVENSDIKDKFVTDKAVLEYVLHRALNLEFEQFSKSEAVEEALREYNKHNDYIQAYIDDAYIPSEYHNLEKVPLIFIKRDIKRYFDEEGLKQHLPYGFGNEIVIRLTKATGGKYTLKKGRLKIEDLAPFPQWTVSDVSSIQVQNIIFKDEY